MTAELVVASLLALLLLTAIFVWIRRRIISGGHPLLVCALSVDNHPWRLGLLRATADQLDWFSVIGPSFRPVRSWGRYELGLGAAEDLDEPVPGLPSDAVMVPGIVAGGQTCALALSRPAYTAVRAWAESAPPGFNVGVA